MTGCGAFESVAVASIELDRTNPRIRKFLEMYPDSPTPEQIYLALGAGGDDEDGGASSTFDKLKNSILTNRGVIMPVILNRLADGRLICIEGNTRVALYKKFVEDELPGDWTEIPSIVHEDADQTLIDSIRLQAHLVGPRAWDPYSKAKYLHQLRHQDHMPFSEIVDFCGGRQKEVQELINAFEDMEKYYRPIVEDDGSFDTRKFSGFRELQKPGVKEAITKAGFGYEHFAKWIDEEKIAPLQKVRVLPRILKDSKARETFLKHGAARAELTLAQPDVEQTLKNVNLTQLARALVQAVGQLPFVESKKIKSDPGGEAAQAIIEAHAALVELMESLQLGD